MTYTTRYANAHTAEARQERQAAAVWYLQGQRGADGKTDRERQLLEAIRRDGLELFSTARWPRYIGKAA